MARARAIALTVVTTLACQDPQAAFMSPQAIEEISGQPYAVVDLGTLGGTGSAATDINNAGQVVGWAQNAAGARRAFLWTHDTLVDLGTLGGDSSVASAINDRGQVVGLTTNAAGEARVFLWTNGVMQDLGPTFASQPQFAFGNVRIDNPGRVVWQGQTPNGTHAFLWRDGVVVNLGTLGGSHTFVTAMNDAGQIVGSSYLPMGGQVHAFLWENGQMRDLGATGPYSSASDINEHGLIVGIAGGDSGHAYPVVWERDHMTVLGLLPGDWNAGGFLVNEPGELVGLSADLGMSKWHPFRWRGGAGGGGAVQPFSPDYRSEPDTRVNAMNNAGVIVGHRDFSQPFQHRAALWRGAAWEELAGLGGTSSQAVALNSRGDAVGWATTVTGVQRAALWRRGGAEAVATQ
jgi:probable HAF family extracellular repeat protein